MPTPFAPYANLRLLFRRPSATPASLREGPRPAAVELVVIEAFAELSAGGDGTEAGGLEIGQQALSGNITRWAILPAGATWLQAGTSWPWNDTGLRPPGLRAGEKLEAWEGPLTALPTITGGTPGWVTIHSLSGTGGIDALVAAEAGDEFSGVFAVNR